MKKDTVVSIDQPETTRDALTEVLREGAQKLIAEAVPNWRNFQHTRVNRMGRDGSGWPMATFPKGRSRRGLNCIPRVRSGDPARN